MRSTSSRRSPLALFLCAVLLAEWTSPWISRADESPAEPALLLKYAASDLPESAVKEILDPLPGSLEESVRVRWVQAPPEPPPAAEDSASTYPIPDDAALRRIAAKVSAAAAHMERVEGEAAETFLAEAEQEIRKHRFTEATRPFLAEIFLRNGMIRLWRGDLSGAENQLSRSRALRPEFSPDPALFPPQFLAAWEAIRRRPLPEAELLVQSLPSGAEITVDGEPRGKTPSRVRLNKIGPVSIRVSHPGFKDARKTGQWVPGDTETLPFTLTGDRAARLAELLAGPSTRKGDGAGPLIAEIAAAAGVERVAVVTLESRSGGDGFRARIYSRGPGGGDPALLGEKEFVAGKTSAGISGKWASGKLLEGGWPRANRKDALERPWYNTWWFWIAILGAAGLAGAAMGGGGGGGSGGSAGAVAVNF